MASLNSSLGLSDLDRTQVVKTPGRNRKPVLKAKDPWLQYLDLSG